MTRAVATRRALGHESAHQRRSGRIIAFASEERRNPASRKNRHDPLELASGSQLRTRWVIRDRADFTALRGILRTNAHRRRGARHATERPPRGGGAFAPSTGSTSAAGRCHRRKPGRSRSPAKVPRADVSRSIETTSTPASTCSTPRRRARHTTGSAPRLHHRRRRRVSHSACSSTRATCRSSTVLVFVSIANATPVGAIATESMSPRPRHGSEWRSRQPSVSSCASARCTSSSERAPTRLRPRDAATGGHRSAVRPSPAGALLPPLGLRSVRRPTPALRPWRSPPR